MSTLAKFETYKDYILSFKQEDERKTKRKIIEEILSNPDQCLLQDNLKRNYAFQSFIAGSLSAMFMVTGFVVAKKVYYCPNVAAKLNNRYLHFAVSVGTFGSISVLPSFFTKTFNQRVQEQTDKVYNSIISGDIRKMDLYEDLETKFNLRKSEQPLDQ